MAGALSDLKMVIKNCISRGGSSENLKGDSPLFSIRAISSHLRSLGYPEKSLNSMIKCGQESETWFYRYCDNCNYNAIHNMRYHCNLRTCPECAERRKKRFRRQYFHYLNELPKGRLYDLYFLTISPKNYKSVSEGIADVKKSYRKFIRSKYIKERLKGSLYVIETTQTWEGKPVYDKQTGQFLYSAKEDSFHVHLHAIIYSRRLDNQIRGKCRDCGQNALYKNYLTGEYHCKNHNCRSTNVEVKQDSKLVRIWQKCSNRSVNINVKRLRKKKRNGNPTQETDTSFTINYMLKYISANKNDFKDAESFALYIKTIHHEKTIGTTGLFFTSRKLKEMRERQKNRKPTCKKCGGTILTIFDFDVCRLKNEAMRKRETFGPYFWIEKSVVPPPQPDFTQKSIYEKGGFD